jgi:hypothetical protein
MFIPTDTPTATATPLACLTQPGRVEQGQLDSFKPTQEFRVYLPPCYDQKIDEHYPSFICFMDRPTPTTSGYVWAQSRWSMI